MSEAAQPVMAGVLDQIQVQALRFARYGEALHRHDWEFEHSDDYRCVVKGRESLKSLRAEQQAIDPSGDLWNSIAPAGYRIGGRS